MFNTILNTTINSSDPIMEFLYWIGLIVCAAAGYSKGMGFMRIPILHFILNGFGGGMTRDAGVLHTTLWFFTLAAIPDTLFTVVAGILYTFVNENLRTERAHNVLSSFVNMLDALTVGSFVAIGADKALSLGYDIRTAIASGYVTATAGGVIANLMHPFAIMTPATIYYHSIVFIGSVVYCNMQNGYIVTLLIAMGLFAEKVNYTAIAMSGYYECVHIFVLVNLDEKIRSIRAVFAKTTERAENIRMNINLGKYKDLRSNYNCNHYRIIASPI